MCVWGLRPLFYHGRSQMFFLDGRSETPWMKRDKTKRQFVNKGIPVNFIFFFRKEKQWRVHLCLSSDQTTTIVWLVVTSFNRVGRTTWNKEQLNRRSNFLKSFEWWNCPDKDRERAVFSKPIGSLTQSLTRHCFQQPLAITCLTSVQKCMLSTPVARSVLSSGFRSDQGRLLCHCQAAWKRRCSPRHSQCLHRLVGVLQSLYSRTSGARLASWSFRHVIVPNFLKSLSESWRPVTPAWLRLFKRRKIRRALLAVQRGATSMSTRVSCEPSHQESLGLTRLALEDHSWSYDSLLALYVQHVQLEWTREEGVTHFSTARISDGRRVWVGIGYCGNFKDASLNHDRKEKSPFGQDGKVSSTDNRDRLFSG